MKLDFDANFVKATFSHALLEFSTFCQVSVESPLSRHNVDIATCARWWELKHARFCSLRIQPPFIRSRYYVRNAKRVSNEVAGANERRLYSQASVFETRTVTGSELFSLLSCPHTTIFTLLRIFSSFVPNTEWTRTFKYTSQCPSFF